MDSRTNPSYAPRFWELDPVKAFQPLCVDILAQESGVETADEYGKNGQAQLGIDIFGKDGSGQIIVVGQCKCYENYKAADVIKAADEFDKHHQHWKKEGVTRFILIVACDLSDKKVQDQIQLERTRFAQIGIYFEAWSGLILRNKLMPYPEIVQRHIHSQEVVRNICGLVSEGLVFTSNASLEITLKELREVVRDPNRYYRDIEDLFIEEAKKVINIVQSSDFSCTLQNASLHQMPESCRNYLQRLIDSSERLVKLSAELIKLDRQGEFIDIIIQTLKILAQDPLKPEDFALKVYSYIQGLPEVCLYPLALMIYIVYIVGVERKTTKLLQEIPTISFRSKRSDLEYKKLPDVLCNMYFENNTINFFIKINNSLAPIPISIKETLLPWLQNYVNFPEDAWWKGEFILGLAIQNSNTTPLFPSIYLYIPAAKDTLQELMKDKQLLQALFPDIEQRLQNFDQLSLQEVQRVPFQRASGFYGNAFNYYKNA